jgi:DNA-directed RNA polymerase specialized sigma24 family protein
MFRDSRGVPPICRRCGLAGFHGGDGDACLSALRHAVIDLASDLAARPGIGPLSPRERQVFVAMVIHGQSYEAVATRLRLSRNAVRATLSRAKRRLRGMMPRRVYTLQSMRGLSVAAAAARRPR